MQYQVISEHLLALGERISSAQYELVHACYALDQSSEWAMAGFPTSAHAVAQYLDVQLSTAREWVRIGKALQTFLFIDDAFRKHEISYSKVEVLTRFSTVDNEAELVEIAKRVPAGQLNSVLAARSAKNDNPDDIDKRQQQQRCAFFSVEPDGGVRYGGYLPALPGAKVKAAVDCRMMRDRKHAPAGASAAQMRADALVALMTEGAGQIGTELIIHVSDDGAKTEDGNPILNEVVRDVIPGSFIRALIKDAQGKPVNLSHKRRFPTTRQRIFVKYRYGVCIDCGSSEFLQTDHAPDYEVTKHTTTDELALRCSRCHAQRHRREAA